MKLVRIISIFFLFCAMMMGFLSFGVGLGIATGVGKLTSIIFLMLFAVSVLLIKILKGVKKALAKE